jgi:hypothetical protein
LAQHSARSGCFVPDIVPIAFAEEPRPGCAVQLAFLLRTVELMTAVVAVLAIVLLLGTWAAAAHFAQGGSLASLNRSAKTQHNHF